MSRVEISRSYRYPLELTDRQVAILKRNSGAVRWAYNYAHATMLAHYRAFDERKQRFAEELTGLTHDQILDKYSKTERRMLYKKARTRVKNENISWCADLKVWDEHRRRVLHMGKPLLDPGPFPGVKVFDPHHLSGAIPLGGGIEQRYSSDLADLLHQRRWELAALQQTNTKKYAAEKKAELAAVRPRVQNFKQDLIARGAHRPDAFDIASRWRTIRDLPRNEGGIPWHKEVFSDAFSCGFRRADVAWKNFMSSAAGKRAGKRMGLPKFKSKRTARDSITIFNPTRAVVTLTSTRRLSIKGLGNLRLLAPAKRLTRLLDKQRAYITSVTISRQGHRWYASILCMVEQDIPDQPTRRQRTNGLIAVDLGSQPLAALSAPLDPADLTTAYIPSAKPLKAEQHRLTRAQQAFSRTTKGSKRRRWAAQAVGRLHHQIALRRAGYLHQASKLLATNATHVAIEDLDLVALTASAKGTVDQPGTNVKVKSTFNRHLLDSGLGELRRQLGYKTKWYGSTLVILDKGEPTATRCSRCGERNPNSTPGNTRFTCPHCGYDVGRRDNSVRNIYRAARRVLTSVASDRGDTQNARGGGTHPRASDGTGPPPSKRTPPA